MTVSLLTVKTVLLFAVCVLLAPLLTFGFPLMPSIVFIFPLAGLVFFHRGFWEPQTLRMLSWAICAVVCFSVLSQVVFVLQISAAPMIFTIAPWLLTALWSTSGDWLALFLGAVAGLRWPDKLLVPVLGTQAHWKLRVTANIVAVSLLAYFGGFLIGLGENWFYWLPWSPWDFSALLFLLMRRLGSLVSDLFVVSLLVVFFTEWPIVKPNFTPQLRRVILGGLAGVVAMMALHALFGGLADGAALLVTRSDRFDYGVIGLLSSNLMVGWLGITLGVWAGLRWPDRLLLPARVSGGTQRTRFTKNIIAIAVYLVLALLAYWILAVGILFVAWN